MQEQINSLKSENKSSKTKNDSKNKDEKPKRKK